MDKPDLVPLARNGLERAAAREAAEQRKHPLAFESGLIIPGEDAAVPPSTEQPTGVKHYGDLTPSNKTVLKETNPKDAAGSARVDFTLISPFAMAEESLALEEGGSKYGYYNYTIMGVKVRTYIGAILRHAYKYLMGETRDPKTGVHHLGSIRATAGILIDAEVRGKLFDDRPPSVKSASTWLDAMEARVKKVREVFKAFRPRHFTIEDTQNGTGEQIHTSSERKDT